MFFKMKPKDLPAETEALKGRASEMPVAAEHFLNGRPLKGPYPDGMEIAYFGLGCFWGAERLFWKKPGVFVTAVGYQGGYTPNPSYEEVCSGMTGHTEAVLVVYDPKEVSFAELLKLFFEEHDPTQGMRQGNDVGTQYRSAIYTTTPEQLEAARAAMRTRPRRRPCSAWISSTVRSASSPVRRAWAASSSPAGTSTATGISTSSSVATRLRPRCCGTTVRRRSPTSSGA